MRYDRNKVCLFYLLLLSCFLSNHPLAARSKESFTNKPERLEWLQDAGFGMFIHWSMDSQLGSVISHSMVGASEDYLIRFIHALPKTFNPKRLDWDEIIKLAKLAGMQYVVFTTKHHSGFCMWDTKTNDFNIMNTPYGQDIVREYVDAVGQHGLGVGFYYSPEDFRYLQSRGIMITRRGPQSDPVEDTVYLEYLKTQMRELMTNYGQVDVMFFDGKGADPLKEMCWSLQPNLLVTRGALNTPEQTLPGVPLDGAWEACITMGTQWQYKPTNEEYKSGGRLIEILIETRAKGGALLLNVGLKPNGELPIEQEERLREIALWHFVNGESIHGTRPWIVTNEDNTWFTRKKDAHTVYAFLTKIPEWPRGSRKSFLIKSVKTSEQSRISVLGQSSKWVEYQPDTDASVKWNQADDGLHVSIVRAQRLYNNHRWHNPPVVKLENVEPALVPPRVRTISTEMGSEGAVFRGELVDLGKATKVQVGFQYRPYAGFVEELYGDAWQESHYAVQSEAGVFRVNVTGLVSGKVYQYRAVVKHPLITVYGDIERLTVR